MTTPKPHIHIEDCSHSERKEHPAYCFECIKSSKLKAVPKYIHISGDYRPHIGDLRIVRLCLTMAELRKQLFFQGYLLTIKKNKNKRI